MGLLQILNNPGNFRFYSGRGSSSTVNSFGQKSIRYGRDRQDGADSGQPYIQTPIPDSTPPQLTDFILRNGALGTTSAIATDESRLFKFFTDTKSPNGLFFTIKQNLLARQNPKEFGTSRVYDPLNTLAQAALTPFGIHIKKDATDPITAAFDLIDPTKTYGYQVRDFDKVGQNRLLLLTDGKINNNVSLNPYNRFSVATSPLNILKYSGGPNAELGLTSTIIKRYSSTNEFFTQLKDTGNSSFLGNVNSPSNLSWLLEANQIATKADNVRNAGDIFVDTFTREYTNKVLVSPNKKTTITSISPNYATKNLTIQYGDLNASAPKNLISYTSGSGLFDSVIAEFNNDFAVASQGDDLVEFKIAILNYDSALRNGAPSEYKFLHFKSFLDNITDAYNASWDSFKYLGRGENFYTYQGFTRTINLGFTVPSFTRGAMQQNYKNLGQLASAVTPNYNPQGGYMRGPLIRLTIGDYIRDQWGFIESFQYEVNGADSTWEINIDDEGNKIPTTDSRWVGELPHHIKVSGFQFIPIQNFVPQTFNGNFIYANQIYDNLV